MMRLKKNILLLSFFILTINSIAAQALAKWRPTQKIDNFIFFQDYSGSMAMHLEGMKDTKIKMSKDLLNKITDAIPELNYKASLVTFAPFYQYIPIGPYNKNAMREGIATLKNDYETFQRVTPIGNSFASLRSVLNNLSGRTSIILLSDGMSNKGIDPVAEATAIYNTYPNVCFHVISYADKESGKMTLDAIASINSCSCKLQNGPGLLNNNSVFNSWINCIFYNTTNLCNVDSMSVSRAIQFDFDDSRIRKNMIPILNETLSILESNCNYEVAGHTCSLGTIKYNKGLSEYRANAVRDYLIKHGVTAPTQLKSVGYGALQPKYDNRTYKGRHLNRRVEIRTLTN